MAGPYLFPTVETFRQWARDVHDAGGLVTVIPPQWSTLNAGAYAARFPAVDGLPRSSYTYVLAPYAVLLWELGQLTQEEYSKAAGDFVDYVESLGSNAAENIGDILGGIGGGVGRGLFGVVSGWWWLLAGVGVVLLVSNKARRAASDALGI